MLSWYVGFSPLHNSLVRHWKYCYALLRSLMHCVWVRFIFCYPLAFTWRRGSVCALVWSRIFWCYIRWCRFKLVHFTPLSFTLYGRAHKLRHISVLEGGGRTGDVFCQTLVQHISPFVLLQGGVISGDNPAAYNTGNPIRLWIIQLGQCENPSQSI